MEEVKEFYQLRDRIKSGLQLLGDEEEELLQLRQQLQKIKKLREDHVQKDQLITSLQERIGLLEHEKMNAHRQNSELHQIMSDRIQALERFLQDKESLEKHRFIEFERIEKERNALIEELGLERKK